VTLVYAKREFLNHKKVFAAAEGDSDALLRSVCSFSRNVRNRVEE